MKIKSIILAAVVALFATSSLSAKSLVVYFSRADENYGVGNITEGNTAILAKMIAQKTGSDIFEIVPEKAYPKSYNSKAEPEGTKTFPCAGLTTRVAPASNRESATRVLNPLNTERMTMRAAVPTAMPATPIPEMRLMTL